jgi:hypothetical protein
MNRGKNDFPRIALFPNRIERELRKLPKQISECAEADISAQKIEP